jgi:hypothetical protein
MGAERDRRADGWTFESSVRHPGVVDALVPRSRQGAVRSGSVGIGYGRQSRLEWSLNCLGVPWEFRLTRGVSDAASRAHWTTRLKRQGGALWRFTDSS